MLTTCYQGQPDEFQASKRTVEMATNQSPWKPNFSNSEGLQELKMSAQKTKDKADVCLGAQGDSQITPKSADHLTTSISSLQVEEAAQSSRREADFLQSSETLSNQDFADEIARPVPRNRTGTRRSAFSRNHADLILKGFSHDTDDNTALGKRSDYLASRNGISKEREVVMDGYEAVAKKARRSNHTIGKVSPPDTPCDSVKVTREVLIKLSNAKLPRLSQCDLQAAQASAGSYLQGKMPQSESLLIDHFLRELLASHNIGADLVPGLIHRNTDQQSSFEERAVKGGLRARHSAQGALRKAKATAALIIHRAAKRLVGSPNERVALRQSTLSPNVPGPHEQSPQLAGLEGSMCSPCLPDLLVDHQTSLSSTHRGTHPRDGCISMVIPGHSVHKLFSNSLQKTHEDAPKTPEKGQHTFFWSGHLSSGTKSTAHWSDAIHRDRGSHTCKDLLDSILAFKQRAVLFAGDSKRQRDPAELDWDKSGHATQRAKDSSSIWEMSPLDQEENSNQILLNSSPSRRFAPFSEDAYVEPVPRLPDKPNRAFGSQPQKDGPVLSNSEPRTSQLARRIPEEQIQPSNETGRLWDERPIVLRKLTF